MIASDAADVGRHPRRQVRSPGCWGACAARRLTLMQALAKMTIMPARRLEKSVPQMAHKGRLAVGADADVTVFDPATVIDIATFEKPAQFARGIVHVLVNGVPVVQDGRTVDGIFPGQPVRRTVAH
jgi:dihydroorotase